MRNGIRRKWDAVLHTILAPSCTGRSIAHVSECVHTSIGHNTQSEQY